MKTMHLGPEELLVAAKIAVAARRDVAPSVAAAIDAAEVAIRDAEPTAQVDLPRARHPTAPTTCPPSGPSRRRPPGTEPPGRRRLALSHEILRRRPAPCLVRSIRAHSHDADLLTPGDI